MRGRRISIFPTLIPPDVPRTFVLGMEEPNLFDLAATAVPEPITVKRTDQRLWTAHKAMLIEGYLVLFVKVAKHGTYLDLFAAPQNAEDAESWAARRVLQAQSLDITKPRLRHFHLCDINPDGAKALEGLAKERSDLDVSVYEGDANELVHSITSGIRPTEATFCLLDQRTFECDWATVRALAAAKKSGNKIELFYFLATGWLDRSIAGSTTDLGLDRLERWWGRPDWERVQGMNGEARAQLLASRFREELGYLSAQAWPIFKGPGSTRVMYHMIHATDHRDAPSLMSRAYRKAVRVQQPPIDQLTLWSEPEVR